MKKKNILIFSSIILIALIVLLIIMMFIGKEKLTVSNKVLDNNYVSIYTLSDNQKIYSEFTTVKYKSKDLNEALKNNLTTMDKLVKGAKKSSGLNDGGTMIYYFKNYDIVKCHKTTNNNSYIEDYYLISDADKVIDNLCK